MWLSSVCGTNESRSKKSRPRRKPARRPSTLCLCLEALEDRWVPTTVTNLNDSGLGSLRDALVSTPANGQIDFAPGLSGTIGLSTGPLNVVKNVTIDGPGTDVISVSGNNASTVFGISWPRSARP